MLLNYKRKNIKVFEGLYEVFQTVHMNTNAMTQVHDLDITFSAQTSRVT